jgi:hypothetical protein
MWQIENHTPFAAGQGWVRDLNGAETWLVVVKATFDISPEGSTSISKKQPQVTRSPIYRNTPGSSSILYENDFVLAKKRTDIVVNGTAYASGTKAVKAFDAGFQVGPVKKVLRIFGDRIWESGGRILSAPQPVQRVPLTYERAYGGVDKNSPNPENDWYWPNPVGTGFVTTRSRISDTLPPNIEYPDQLITSWNSQPLPAGFGVIASHWRERAMLSGTFDDAWSESRQPLLPLDFDIGHYQSVPADQQAPVFFRGGEYVTLLNLTPEGLLRFTLPVIELYLETYFMDGERRPHDPPLLHTVILEPDFPRLSLVWHSAVECHAKAYRLCRTRIEVVDQVSGTEEEEEFEGEVDDLLSLI